MKTIASLLLLATTAYSQQLVFSGTTPGKPQTESYWQAVEARQAANIKQMAARGEPDSHVKFDGEREWHADPSAAWKAEYVRTHGKGWVSISETGRNCYPCPACGGYHCGPGGGGQPSQPNRPGPQEEFPQYEPWPPQDTHPPTNPPTTDPSTPPITQPEPPSNEPPPEPTIDQESLDELKREAIAEATAAAKAEVSVLIQNELANVQACDCGPKWAAIELRLAAIEKRNMEAGDAQAIVNVNVQNALTALADSIEAAKPSVDEVADEVLARLDHDTPIRVYLPDGRLAGESKTNIFRGESIDFTFNPRALLDQTAPYPTQ